MHPFVFTFLVIALVAIAILTTLFLEKERKPQFSSTLDLVKYLKQHLIECNPDQKWGYYHKLYRKRKYRKDTFRVFAENPYPYGLCALVSNLYVIGIINKLEFDTLNDILSKYARRQRIYSSLYWFTTSFLVDKYQQENAFYQGKKERIKFLDSIIESIVSGNDDILTDKELIELVLDHFENTVPYEYKPATNLRKYPPIDRQYAYAHYDSKFEKLELNPSYGICGFIRNLVCLGYISDKDCIRALQLLSKHASNYTLANTLSAYWFPIMMKHSIEERTIDQFYKYQWMRIVFLKFIINKL